MDGHEWGWGEWDGDFVKPSSGVTNGMAMFEVRNEALPLRARAGTGTRKWSKAQSGQQKQKYK